MEGDGIDATNAAEPSDRPEEHKRGMSIDNHQSSSQAISAEPAAADSAAAASATHASSDVDRLQYVLLGLSAALALVAIFFACLSPAKGTDFFWQVKTGQLILQTRHIPHTDPFSWTAYGQPWTVQEWLVTVLFHLMVSHLPPWTLLLYKGGLPALVGALVLWRAWIRSGSWLLSIGVALTAGFALEDFAAVRPQLVTNVILAGLLLCLDQYRRGRARFLPYLLPAVFALWANVHAAAVVGLVLIAVWIAGDAIAVRLFHGDSPPLKPLAYGLAASALAIGLNPNGFGLYAYPFQVLHNPVVINQIAEWTSPSFHSSHIRYFELLLLGTPAAMALAGRCRGWMLGDLLLLLLMAHAALVFKRNIPPFAIAAAPVMAGALAAAWQTSSVPESILAFFRRSAVQRAAAAGLAALLLLLIWHRIPRVRPDRWVDYALDMVTFPRAGATFLASGRCPGRLYNDYNWGGYLIWRLYPQRRVFLDPRAEVYYKVGAYDDHVPLQQAEPGWQDKLDRWGVQVILTWKEGRLAQALHDSRQWHLEFTGPVEVIYTRATL
jgi:hypothetical protein